LKYQCRFKFPTSQSLVKTSKVVIMLEIEEWLIKLFILYYKFTKKMVNLGGIFHFLTYLSKKPYLYHPYMTISVWNYIISEGINKCKSIYGLRVTIVIDVT
jgi:hypothetical protein